MQNGDQNELFILLIKHYRQIQAEEQLAQKLKQTKKRAFEQITEIMKRMKGAIIDALILKELRANESTAALNS